MLAVVTVVDDGGDARAFGTKKKLVSVLSGKIHGIYNVFWTAPTAKTLVFMQFSACCKKPFFHAKVK